MQRLSRLTRIAPHQPTLYTFRSRIGPCVPPRVRGLASISDSKPKARFNEIQVQHISDQLHGQIFGNDKTKPPSELVDLAKHHLDLHDLLGKQTSPTEAIGFELPPLRGETLDEHFFRLGTYTAKPWLDYAQKFAEPASSLPKVPKTWQTAKSGWTRYDAKGNPTIMNGPPEDEMLVFDVEVLWKLSPYPVIACAASPTNWYSWISPQVTGESTDDKHLIPLGDGTKPRIVVGHNISYDRARIQEEYNLEQSNTFFLDTMSMHAAVNGMCSRQRPMWMKHRKNKELREKMIENATPELANTIENIVEDMETELWIEQSSINSLRDVAMFHTQQSISKETRDEMGEMKSVDELKIEDKLQQCLSYCAADVAVTYLVYQKVLPAFLQTCPHPVSFAALRHMGSLLLPVNPSWNKYIENAEETYQKLLERVNSNLKALTEKTVELGFKEVTEVDEKKDKSVTKSDLVLKKTRQPPKLTAAEVEEAQKIIAESLEKEKEIQDEIKELERVAAAKKADKELKAQEKGETLTPTRYRSPKGVPDMKKAIIDLQKQRGVAEAVVSRAEDESRVENLTDIKDENSTEIMKETTNTPPPVVTRKPTNENIEIIEKDPWSGKNAWLSQLDWSGRDIKYKKQKKPDDPLVPVARQKLPGYPNWYKSLFPKSDAPMNISVRTRMAPLMLQLEWDGYPLVWTDKYGWTFRVPNTEIEKYEKSPLARCDELLEESNPNVAQDTEAVYFKLPHNGNGTTRCVSPLAKGYQRYFESGVLRSAYPQAKEALEMNAACSYWISARERIKSQFVVWEEDIRAKQGKDGPGMGFASQTSSQNDNQKLGLILPQIVTMGTITRRAVENTWLTASNAKANRVGSELKAMIQAPPGYCFVGADVDSEELWIASLIGDAEFKLHGGNAIGFMTLEGSKAAETDMHSRTAKVLGISRNNAKIFNYGRIYGAGLKFAANLLRQFNPNVNEAEADKIAQELYKVTKGTKVTRKALTDQQFWRGGTESFVFNKLEQFANQPLPRTPVLGAGITQALQIKNINKGAFLTSRINWAIQSSGVDYLHLLIVSMDYLIRQYGLQARLMITVHDEIRYIAKEEDKYKVAMALQIANLWTRAMFSQQMGINDLPQSCAFFSAVDIDNVLRKEVDLSCVTPSNPNPIPPGESLDITQLLEKPEAKLPSPTGNIIEEQIKEIEYERRVPIMEELAETSGPNIYFMKAQVAMDNRELTKVIKELELQAPHLINENKSLGSQHWSKGGVTSSSDDGWEEDGWAEIKPQKLTRSGPRNPHQSQQMGYGWKMPDEGPSTLPRTRKTQKLPETISI